jgi:hypothetical protein
VAVNTKHTISNLLRHKHDNNDKYDNSRIYQLTVANSTLDRLVGPSKPGLKNIRDYETKSSKSLFAKHPIDSNHQLYSMENSLTILSHQQKGTKMNTIEQYHIYKIPKKGNQLNEQFTEKQNPIFEAILKIYPDD